MGNAVAYLGWGFVVGELERKSLPWVVRAQDEFLRLFEFEDFVAELYGMAYPATNYDARGTLVAEVGLTTVAFGYVPENPHLFVGVTTSVQSTEAGASGVPFIPGGVPQEWYDKLKSFYQKANLPWPGDAQLGWWLMLVEY